MKKKVHWSKWGLAATAAVFLCMVSVFAYRANQNSFAFWKSSAAQQTQQTLEWELSAVHSSNVLLVQGGNTLLEKNSNQKIYPASLTKIMTVLVAIEHMEKDSAKVTLPANIFQDLAEKDAAVAGFVPGEKVQARDLLYGAMLPSGADASRGLAIHIAGSEQEFVKMMNDKAKELGMSNTHFTNVVGFHDAAHVTTAQDLSTLLQYAWKNETFRKVFTKKEYTTGPTPQHPSGIVMESSLFKNQPTIASGKIVGGKTGYTQKAGQCLASVAQIQDKTYFLITTGAKGDIRAQQQWHIDDAVNLYNQIPTVIQK